MLDSFNIWLSAFTVTGLYVAFAVKNSPRVCILIKFDILWQKLLSELTTTEALTL